MRRDVGGEWKAWIELPGKDRRVEGRGGRRSRNQGVIYFDLSTRFKAVPFAVSPSADGSSASKHGV